MSEPAALSSIDWLMTETHCSEHAARQALQYVAAQQAAIATVPTQTEVVFERFFDDTGGMQLVVHAPFGGRINRAWGLAMRKRFCRSFDFELQATADDDGFILSLGPQHSFPIEALFPMLRTDNVRNLLEQALLVLPLFHLRWRWNATRALQLERMRHGKKVPPALQRFRSEDLLTAVFPKLTGCQEEHTGDHIIPDHPLVRQTVDDALFEALDLDSLLEVLARVERGEITFVARDTREPSPFAYELLNANPYAFLDGGEIQERRTRMVETQRTLTVESVRDLGRLDPLAIQTVLAEAQPLVRDADELHDLLLSRYLLPDAVDESGAGGLASECSTWLGMLAAEGRAARVRFADGRSAWAPAERWEAIRRLFPDAVAEPPLVTPAGIESPGECADVRTAIVRGLMETAGPLTAKELADRLGQEESATLAALEALEGEGCVLRGSFRPAPTAQSAASETSAPVEWCHRRLLLRIHRLTVAGLRREIEPVDVATYWRFLARRHGLTGGPRDADANRLYEVIGLLQGLDLPAAAWEQDLLPQRIEGYRREWLDELCLNGEVGWGRLFPPPRDPEKSRPMASVTRTVPVSIFLREDAGWLSAEAATPDVAGLSSVAQQLVELLRARGALFATDILESAQLLPAQLDDVLGELVARGLVTSDGFAGLRGLVRETDPEREEPVTRGRPKLVRRRRAQVTAGRWSLWRGRDQRRDSSDPQDPHDLRESAAHPAQQADSSPLNVQRDRRAWLEQWAWQLLRRWGVVFRDLLAKEAGAPAWWELVPVLRRMEMRGEIRGGRFVAGVGGEQYASGEVVQQLRQMRREVEHPSERERSQEGAALCAISAADPLNLVGLITPHSRVPSLANHRVVYCDGVPVADLQADRLTFYPECPGSLQHAIAALVGVAPPAADGTEELTDRHARRFARRKKTPPSLPRSPRPLIS